jgi:hypothetical protein
MLFKDRHIEQIRTGEKTVTRREWAENYHGPTVGSVVAAKTDLFTPNSDCDCFIRIVDKREERLGDITEASARREGDYESVAEFREGYEDVYGPDAWGPEKVVTVVRFQYVGTEPVLYARSPITGEYYKLYEWDHRGGGKVIAEAKEPVERGEVPEFWLPRLEGEGVAADV